MAPGPFRPRSRRPYSTSTQRETTKRERERGAGGGACTGPVGGTATDADPRGVLSHLPQLRGRCPRTGRVFDRHSLELFLLFLLLCCRSPQLFVVGVLLLLLLLLLFFFFCGGGGRNFVRHLKPRIVADGQVNDFISLGTARRR